MINNTLKILAIDDNKDNLLILRAIISEAFPDAVMFQAENGLTGIEMAHQNNPDVILLDIVMPVIDGLEVCKKLKSEHSVSHIPVVFLTAIKTDHLTRVKALEAGSEAFLSKPLEAAELTAQIRAMAKIKVAADKQRREVERLEELVSERTAKLEDELTQRREAEEELKRSNLKLQQSQKAMLNLLEDLKVREEGLLQSEAQKKAILDGITTNIAFVNERLEILWANKTAAISVEKNHEEITGKKCYEIWADPEKPCDNCPTIEAFRTGSSVSRQMFTPDGRVWDERGEPVIDSEGKLIGVVEIARDITEKVQADKKIRELLDEKELLLKEVHHRIKNNMNTINGLLTLQAQNTGNSQAAAVLEDARNRVLSMMVLYDKLYRSTGFSEVPLDEYLGSLIDEIISNFPENQKLKIEKHLENVKLDSKIIYTLGIIVNELITNAMKHAFKDKDNCLLSISASIKEKRVVVCVGDNGCENPDIKVVPGNTGNKFQSGFGLQLVTLLVEQLQGSIKINRNQGWIFTIEFEFSS